MIPRISAETIRQLRGAFQPGEVLGDLQPCRDHVTGETDDVFIVAADQAKRSPVHTHNPPPGVEHNDRVEHLVDDQGITDRSDVDQLESPQQQKAEHARHHESGRRPGHIRDTVAG